MNEHKQKAMEAVDQASERLCALSDSIWDAAETAYRETRSAALQIEALRELGFQVEGNLAGIPTAFSGRFGQGRPVIGILGEFDALSGLSQKAGCAVKEPLEQGGSGHGCGHNLLGVGGIGAALAVRRYLLDTGKSGTVIYYGCPAEEGGSGKSFMARDGVFDELDCALTWHPKDGTFVLSHSTLANVQINYRFTGVSAHAAACPHLGRSALDACELMNVGVQFLREHIIPVARVHYAITDTGGFSPNVVQPTAQVLYLIRAPRNEQVEEIRKRVDDIARGAALMTGTSVEIEFVKACSNIVPNRTLGQALRKGMEETPVPVFDDEDRALAQAMHATTDAPGVVEQALQALPPEARKKYARWQGAALYDLVLPAAWDETPTPGSSDVGDVSWVCPTAWAMVATMAAGTPEHSWQLTAQGKSGLAHKGMLQAAKILAGTAINLIDDPETVEAAKAELRERLGGRPFVSPIPAGAVPRALGMGT